MAVLENAKFELAKGRERLFYLIKSSLPLNLCTCICMVDRLEVLGLCTTCFLVGQHIVRLGLLNIILLMS